MIIDISQEVFSCNVFPGDPAPMRNTLLSIKDGAVCNLTAFYMCAHNGTHVDAPFHFIQDGKTVDQIPLDHFVGPCWVSRHDGFVTGEDADAILEKAHRENADKRILIAGKATVTEEAAKVFAHHGVWLVGNESQTVGPEDAPKRVHEILLGSGAVLLEGIVLTTVPEGTYTLHAAPLSLGGSDGAPCRAYLMHQGISEKMTVTFLKLEIFIPETHLDALQTALRGVDAGHIGNYDCCLSYSHVMSTWRPLTGTNPFIGKENTISCEHEIKVEVTIRAERLKETMDAIKRVHPYEEPVINVIPLWGTSFQ